MIFNLKLIDPVLKLQGLKLIDPLVILNRLTLSINLKAAGLSNKQQNLNRSALSASLFLCVSMNVLLHSHCRVILLFIQCTLIWGPYAPEPGTMVLGNQVGNGFLESE